MRITLVGSRHFGVTTFDMLRKHGVEIVRVVVADADDRLAAAARAAGIEVTVQADPKLVVAKEIAEGTDLIVTAHSHARISHGSAVSGQARRDRLPSVVAAASSRHRRGRVDHPRRRPHCRRHGLSSGRPHGCRRNCRAGMVFRQERRDGAGVVGTRAGAAGPEAARPGDRLCQDPQNASRQRPRTSNSPPTRRSFRHDPRPQGLRSNLYRETKLNSDRIWGTKTANFTWLSWNICVCRIAAKFEHNVPG